MLNSSARRCFCSSSRSLQPWLFVGLGNPGDKYRRTRHNVFFGDVPIFLAKPQSCMNLSGESAGPSAACYKMPLNRVLVLHDDMDLP